MVNEPSVFEPLKFYCISQVFTFSCVLRQCPDNLDTAFCGILVQNLAFAEFFINIQSQNANGLYQPNEAL